MAGGPTRTLAALEDSASRGGFVAHFETLRNARSSPYNIRFEGGGFLQVIAGLRGSQGADGRVANSA